MTDNASNRIVTGGGQVADPKPPAGPARRNLTGCIKHGHPLVFKPNGSRLRYCRTCARLAAEDQHNAIGAAHRCLGMTKREYVAQYGQSTKKALAVLADCERASAFIINEDGPIKE